MAKTKLKVSAIKDGTVIDHIHTENLFKVINILGLDKIKNQVTFGMNLESKKIGGKAIIKISNKFFEQEEINKIAMLAPNANLNVIRDYEVVEKKIVEIPDQIVGIAKCFNPKCISNFEHMDSMFTVVSKNPLEVKCHYCEKINTKEQLIIK
ncbi:aspartate carbamoyltransferase regulatory subunit [Puteibacter caeruleilacunae]|nr:aspartate carbamoyltransferase regulatory subunit [Puteibacter caeruleilacunae]